MERFRIVKEGGEFFVEVYNVISGNVADKMGGYATDAEARAAALNVYPDYEIDE